MRLVFAKPAEKLSKFTQVTSPKGRLMASIVVGCAEPKNSFVVNKGFVVVVAKPSMPEQAKLGKAMLTTVQNFVGQRQELTGNLSFALSAIKNLNAEIGKSKKAIQGFVQRHAMIKRSESSALMVVGASICLHNGKSGNGKSQPVAFVVLSKIYNSTISFLASPVVVLNGLMRKLFVGAVTDESIGKRTYLTIHGFISTVPMDVDKFSLIDLEAKTLATGRKAQATVND